MKSTKKGFSLVELGIVVAIITVIAGIVLVNGYNLYQNSIDTKIQQDLKSLTNSTQLFMVDSNGLSPCWSPKAKEGTNPADGICAKKYDFRQGKTTENADVDLDFDKIEGEEFTLQNILAPSYINSIPRAARNGQNYFYTRGKNDTVLGQTSYAYSAPLAGNKAEEKLANNDSILNTVGDVTVETPCTASDLNYNSVTTTEDTASTPVQKFKIFTTIKGTTGLTNENCDVYTDGLNVVKEAFDTNATIKSISVQPTK